MTYHDKVTVAVATRHRTHMMEQFLRTLHENTSPDLDFPYVTVVHDAPMIGQKRQSGEWEPPQLNEMHECEELLRKYAGLYTNTMIPHKSSMAEMWNHCVMFAPTEWVLICNDDVLFQPGWLEYLLEKINSGNYLEVDLACYAGFCITKRMILKLGWFDERFRGGAHEDHDWQLRAGEAGWHNNEVVLRASNKAEKLIHKTHAGLKWKLKNNAEWLCEKWGRSSAWNYTLPSYRRHKEIDWHPTYTKMYEEEFGEKAVFLDIEPSDEKVMM